MYSNLVDTIGFLKGIDPDVADAMDKELARQKRNLELIASENNVSPAVMFTTFYSLLLCVFCSLYSCSSGSFTHVYWIAIG